MVVGYIVLWELTCVFFTLVGEQVGAEGFLRDDISFVLFVAKDGHERGGIPFVLLSGSFDSTVVQHIAYRLEACTCVVGFEYLSDSKL